MKKRLVGFSFLVIPVFSYAFEWGVSASSGLEYNSNAFLDESASVSELQRDVSLSTNLLYQSKASFIGGSYQVNRNYYPDSFATDTTVQGRSEINIDVLPGNISWIASHLRMDTLRDFNANDTPDNRAIRENFKTGPVLFLRLSPTDMLQSSFTRSWTMIEFEPGRDSETDTTSISYNRNINALTNASISISRSEISFDHTLGYESSSQSISLSRKIKDGNFSLLVGNNEVEQRLLTSKSPLMTINISKNIYDTGFSLGYSKMLTHTSLDLSDFEQDLPNFGLIDVAEVIERDTFRGGISKNINDQFRISLNAYTDTSISQRTKISYDRKGVTARGEYVRPLSPSSSATTSYMFDYLESGQRSLLDESTRHSFSASYKNQMTNDLSLIAAANYSTRAGSKNFDYDRSSLSVRMSYVFR